jgi:hypothetical protein
MAPVTQDHLRVEVGKAKEGKKGSKGKKPQGFVPLLYYIRITVDPPQPVEHTVNFAVSGFQIPNIFG